MSKLDRIMEIARIVEEKPPRLLVLYDDGQRGIVQLIAHVLGQGCTFADTPADVSARLSDHAVIGLDNALVTVPAAIATPERTIISTHAVDVRDLRDERLTGVCDYEYLYTLNRLDRARLARFLAFVLGDVRPLDALRDGSRSFMLTIASSDVRPSLPNLDICSVGVDAVELRVDLLKEPVVQAEVAGLKYVGDQVMLLRQATDLPIVFSARSRRAGGRFPDDSAMAFYIYLRMAIQWGCEYIEVETWLPELLKSKIGREKGNSKIIASAYGSSRDFCWGEDAALRILKTAASHGDIVKMTRPADSMEDYSELEAFRKAVQVERPRQLFCGYNTSSRGQVSCKTNGTLIPVGHPLLPLMVTSSGPSVAEMIEQSHNLERLPSFELLAVGSLVCRTGMAAFIGKCVHELGLTHHVRCINHLPAETADSILAQRPCFGGAFLSCAFAADKMRNTKLTDAAARIGYVDTLIAQSTPTVGDNVAWQAIRAALTRQTAASAFRHRAALVIGDRSRGDASAAAVFALQSLRVGAIYTVGFEVKGALACRDVRQLRRAQDLADVDVPFAVISALPAARAAAVVPLLQAFGGSARAGHTGTPGIFLDLTSSVQEEGRATVAARQLGWTVQGAREMLVWQTVLTVRALLSANIGYDFVEGRL